MKIVEEKCDTNCKRKPSDIELRVCVERNLMGIKVKPINTTKKKGKAHEETPTLYSV